MMKRHFSTAILLCLCIGFVVLVRTRTDAINQRWRTEERKADSGRIRPRHASSVVIFEFLGAGFKPLVADMFWVRVTTLKADELFEMRKTQAVKGMPRLLEHVHMARTGQEKYEMYELLRSVTLFDPRFEYAYFYGAHLLAFDGEPDLAISLLDFGLRHNPDSGMIPGLLSFIYFYFKGHDYFDLAARYAAMSYKNSGSQASGFKEASTMFAASKNYDMAIAFLTDVLMTTNDPGTSSEVTEQLKYLYVEKNIQELQELADRYIARYDGEIPENLDVFVKMGFIKQIPDEPFGGKYIITKDGRVRNEPYNRFEHYQNLRDYIPEHGVPIDKDFFKHAGDDLDEDAHDGDDHEQEDDDEHQHDEHENEH